MLMEDDLSDHEIVANFFRQSIETIDKVMSQMEAESPLLYKGANLTTIRAAHLHICNTRMQLWALI